VRLVLETETRARLEMSGDGFEIASEGAPISPYHLLAGSLASCTALTLQSWAEGAGIDMAPLTIHVAWENAEERPARIERVETELRWPGLPEERVATAERVADLCPIHATLERAAELSRRVVATPREG
jgi:putative redox protein